MKIEETYQNQKPIYTRRHHLRFSIHARERMAEYGINDSWVENLWQKSNRVQMPLKYESYKLRHYGVIGNVRYYSRCGYLLTTGLRDGKPFLITITKKYSGPIKIK